MDQKKTEILNQLFGQDLSGWQLVECIVPELVVSVMGYFPALDEDRNVLGVLNEEDLSALKALLPDELSRPTRVLALVNLETEVGFALGGEFDPERPPFRVLSSEAIQRLSVGSVCWR